MPDTDEDELDNMIQGLWLAVVAVKSKQVHILKRLEALENE